MLLTSGQISMTISSCVVFTFTTLLFLSGYVLQQQTVHNIQAVIKPPKPTRTTAPVPVVSSPPLAALEFGDPPGSRGQYAFQDYLSLGGPPGGWRKVAYVQVVTDHMLACNALMLFADLQRKRSKASRVLLYPKSWSATEGLEGDDRDTQLETSRRLLKMASRLYDVVLSPVESVPKPKDAPLPASYLVHLFSLTRYKQILYLAPSGLLLNPNPLEAAFFSPSTRPLSATPTNQTSQEPSTSLLLIRPSEEEYSQLRNVLASDPSLSAGDLVKGQYPNSLLPTPAPTKTKKNSAAALRLVRVSEIQEPVAQVNATTLFSSTGYIQIDTPHLPGPEYDIPRNKFLDARPFELEAIKVWDNAYAKFREERMEVCGLDLEPWKG